MLSERLRWLRTKCSRLFRRGKQEAALAAEMQFHLDQLIAQFRADGMSEHDARLAAQREFGAEGAAYREEIRDTWRPPQLADLSRTFRFAFRSLARSPGFTVLAMITLALGIGGNTMMFSAFDTIVLRTLPYRASAELDRIYRTTPQNPDGNLSPADFLELQQNASGYGEVAAYAPADTSLSEPGQPAEMASGLRVTSNLFSLLGVQPELGCDFRKGEDIAGNDRVVILSRRCWEQRFGSNPDIIGRAIRVDGEPNEVVGVLPASFNDWRHLGWVDLFRPIGLTKEKSADRQNTSLRVIGRRAAKVSQVEARAFIENFGARLAKDFPEVNAGSTWRLVSLNQTVQGKSGGATIAMLIGLSGFVLLIACSNLANLLLARTMARAREFAVRSALGASRLQLLRPLIAESLLLALAGGALAILVAQWGAEWLAVRSTGDNGERVILAFNWSVFGWTFVASLVTAVAFGLAPALFALRLDVNDTLKTGARGMTGGRGQQTFRQVLIVGQFALAMILLAGAGLFIRGLDELNHRRAGWQSEHLVTGTVVLPAARYSGPDKINSFHRLALERLDSLPGIASSSISAVTPFFNWLDARKYFIEGRPHPQPGHEPAAVVNSVTPRYFETVGTRIIAGRAFTARDTTTSTKVFIINQAMAAGLFPGENPLGRRLAAVGGATASWGEIVGVAADVKSVLPDSGPVTFQLYQPMAQAPQAYDEIAVRTAGVAPATVIESIRGVMTGLDPDLPVRKLQTADATIERTNYQTAVLRDLLSGFAVLGLGLASLGIYGVIARTMAQRRSEFAIRFALGACIKDITRIVLASGIRMALLGSVLGLLGALGVMRFLAAANPGMQLNSPPVLFGTTLLLIAVALIACWLPARRAARINPLEALRAE
ncbi:MAG TPA: ABC transporter permease [Chthoniobacterales bacterium]|jgi:predicted permease